MLQKYMVLSQSLSYWKRGRNIPKDPDTQNWGASLPTERPTGNHHKHKAHKYLSLNVGLPWHSILKL